MLTLSSVISFKWDTLRSFSAVLRSLSSVELDGLFSRLQLLQIGFFVNVVVVVVLVVLVSVSTFELTSSSLSLSCLLSSSLLVDVAICVLLSLLSVVGGLLWLLSGSSLFSILIYDLYVFIFLYMIWLSCYFFLLLLEFYFFILKLILEQLDFN